MLVFALISILLSAGALVSAAPSKAPPKAPPKAPSKPGNCSSCTFSDAAAAMGCKASCTNIVIKDMTVPAGTTLDLTNLKSGTTVTFQGFLNFGYKEWLGPLIFVSGTNIKVVGAENSLIDCDGKRWWDGQGSNGGKQKPNLFWAHSMFSSSITGLNIKNTPVQAFSIFGSTNLTLNDITIDDTDGDVAHGGHNTDGFDIGESTYIHINNANVKNQDDCVAINSGNNIYVTNATCANGHGISIGSVGGRANNVVKDVIISNSTIRNSENGIRIKTVAGAHGSVSCITYQDITLENIVNYAIIIRQDYKNGNPTNFPTNGVPITDVSIHNVKGTIAGTASRGKVLCAKGACSKFSVSAISLTGGKQDESVNKPEGVSF